MYNAGNNRINGVGYDNRGNQTLVSPYTLAYDQEDRQISAVSSQNGSASYTYDGDGRRVQKMTCSDTTACTAASSNLKITTYIYDAFGQLAAEYGSLAASNGTEYLTADHLGSTRLDDLSWDERFIGAANGTEVLFDGVPAPMIYTSAGQVAGVVPYLVAGKSTTSIQVMYEGVVSSGVSVSVTDSSPALFLAPTISSTQAAVLNQDGSYNSPAHPEQRGNQIVLFATGQGQTSPAGIDGALANSTPLPKPLLPVSVSIGGQNANILYYGAAPGEIAGVMQINVAIPASAPTGRAIPVGLTVGKNTSPTNATVSIR